MKSSSVYVLVAGVVTASVLPLTGVASAVDPANHAGLGVAAGGIKKATATWDDWTADPLTAPFDAYLVTADDDSANGPFDADRSRFVDDSASRSVTVDDLTAGTTYYFNLYAVDYTDTGIDIVSAVGDPALTPIGYVATAGSTLTINNSADVVLSGTSVTVYGMLTDDAGPRAGATVTVESDAFPFEGDGWSPTTTETNSAGEWSKSFAPILNTRYRAFYTEVGIGGWTRNVTVEVRKKISVVVAPNTTVSDGTQLRFSGKLGGDPTLFQSPTSEPVVKACLQRFTGGVWAGSIKCEPVNADGTYLIRHTPPSTAKYRISSGMGPAYADSWSETKRITVN